jgi:hypothetical protein
MESNELSLQPLVFLQDPFEYYTQLFLGLPSDLSPCATPPYPSKGMHFSFLDVPHFILDLISLHVTHRSSSYSIDSQYDK